MNEDEWLSSTDPLPLLEFLAGSGQVSDRKLRLFAVACCRRVWDRLDDLGRGAVEMAELFADGLTGGDELRAARLACKSAGGRAVWYAAASDPRIAARNTVLSIQSGVCGEAEFQVHLLRDVSGNPFRPVTIDAAWLRPNVTALARTIYEGRDFRDMQNLGNALEEAGCSNTIILGHCRGAALHARGCWLLDLVLGKEKSQPAFDRW